MEEQKNNYFLHFILIMGVFLSTAGLLFAMGAGIVGLVDTLLAWSITNINSYLPYMGAGAVISGVGNFLVLFGLYFTYSEMVIMENMIKNFKEDEKKFKENSYEFKSNDIKWVINYIFCCFFSFFLSPYFIILFVILFLMAIERKKNTIRMKKYIIDRYSE